MNKNANLGNFSNKRCRVAVIGAGASGITTAKCLRDDNHDPVVFEKTDKPGGIWVFKKSSGGTFSSVHLQNSKYSAAFSDYPMPEYFSEFPHHTEVLQYLNEYIDHFKIRDCFRFNTNVEKITKKDNLWEVTTQSKDGIARECFDAVAVCSGIYSEPKWPKLPGEENFTGKIIHAQDYKEPSIFADKNVVILGNGPSGVDIAVTASYVAKNLFWSFRRNMWMLPRYYLGMPIDFNLKRINKLIPHQLIQKFFNWKFLKVITDHQKTNLVPKFGILNSVPVINESILNRVHMGDIKTKPSISGFEGNKVMFQDGTTIEADVVVYATGYRISLPFFDSCLLQRHKEGFDFYKNVFHPQLPNCAFIGFVYGSFIFPCSELQARWFSKVISGEVSLPCDEQMMAEIKISSIQQKKKWIATGYRSLQISTLEYMDEIANQINAMPKIWRHWKILRNLLTGPMISTQYRLDGPNQWEGAQEWIGNFLKIARKRNGLLNSKPQTLGNQGKNKDFNHPLKGEKQHSCKGEVIGAP